VILLTVAVAGYGIAEAWGAISTGGVTPLQWVFVGLFAVNFAWVSLTLSQAVLGTIVWAGSRLPGPWTWRDAGARPVSLRTAVLIPVYEEAPVRVAANALTMARALAVKCPGQFAVFLLSDTRSVDHWLHEEEVFRRAIASAPASCPLYYRNRAANEERKAGNVAEWVTRFGAAWDAMLVLDADSLMGDDCICRLAARLEANPDLGLIQSLPRIVRGRTLFARLQQFAANCYGPVYARGLAAWFGRSGNYWGHNAILRTAAFAASARLPVLPGRSPRGGDILSHDFVEAAFLRRSGWGVRFDADLDGSYEESPPTLIDSALRDRRWCQGNLQHLGVIGARGLRLATRLHLLTGIYSYLSAPVWLGLVLVGLGLALQVQLVPPDYFSQPSLFPTWPVFDTERAIRLLLTTVGVVIAPKLLGGLTVLLDPRRWRAFGGPLNTQVSIVWETVLSALYAPVLMAEQCRTVVAVVAGVDGGWKPQRREGGEVSPGALIRMHWWHMLAGAGLAALGWWIEPDLLWWLAPVTVGLVLSVPLSAASGSETLGVLCRWVGLGRAPGDGEDIAVLAEARRALRDRSLDAAPPVASARADEVLSALAERPVLRRWHFAQQPLGQANDPRCLNETLLGALAKADRSADLHTLAEWLSPEQLRELLTFRDFERRLAGKGPRRPVTVSAAWRSA
jgi:membrane glycosyltransferase